MWSINGLNYELKSTDLTKVAIDACTQLGYDIPRFCYHENLKIAGNCRMCLIEDVKAPKPIICCAMTVSPNLTIFTNTLRVKKARESVMEFLLINHPLDCPICDQGGECDLQDLALVYGSDHGRFYEYKRNVEDKNCGSIIKTIMNRCILCTRCVRFSIDVSNFTTFGTTGRGSKMEIGSYIEKALLSELSGNLVDVCPVGALTSKPYAFLARPWELKKLVVLNIFDDYIQQLRADTKENTLIRLMPSKNNLRINTWITNKVRFSYEGLQRSRSTKILVNNIEVSWLKFLNVFSFSATNLLNKANLSNLSLFSFCLKDFTDLKLIINSWNFLSSLGSSYFFSKQVNNLNTLSPIYNLYNIEAKVNSFTFLGLNMEWDAPIFNIILNSFTSPTSLIAWFSILNYKKFDIIFLGNSLSAVKSFLLGKHWVSSFINIDSSSIFFNYLFNWVKFISSFNFIPVYPTGASLRNLNIISSIPTHVQNIKNILHSTSFSINNKTSAHNNLLSITQSSHKFKDLFSLPSQTVYEQNMAEFYDNTNLKVQTNKAVTTNIFIKPNYTIIKAFSVLMCPTFNNNYNDLNTHFNYEINTSIQVNFFSKNLFKNVFILTNNLFSMTTKLSYLTNNLLSLNSLTTTSTLRLENNLNIY